MILKYLYVDQADFLHRSFSFRNMLHKTAFNISYV